MKRPIRIDGDIAYVPLTKGYEAVIDATDVPLVDGFNWCANLGRRADGSVRTIYAVRQPPRGDAKRKAILIHRVIMGATAGGEFDHRDGDGLNNRRDNLRAATVAQNQMNQRVSLANTSGAKGVTWDKSRQKWAARIKLSGKTIALGRFTSLSEAAEAYATASARLHGEFGRIS